MSEEMTEEAPTTEGDQKVEKYDLDLHVFRLLMDEPFFAALSRRISKTADSSIPTAGVRVTPEGKLEMIYNPDFMGSQTDLGVADILKHEFYHIILRHVTGGRFLSFADLSASERKLHNIAMDLAINGYLPNLPEMACFPGKGPFAHLPPYKAAEFYLKELRKMQKEDDGNGGGGGGPGGEGNEKGAGPEGNPGPGGLGDIDSFDDHDGWDKVDEQTRQIAEQRVQEFVKDAINEAQKNSQGWGTVPGNLRKDIIASVKTQLDWKKMLRYFVKQSQNASKRSSIRKINKRYPYQHPGKKSSRTAKIAIAIDQSGSVSDEMLNAFFSELNSLAKIASFTVIPFDTRVDDSLVYEWKKGQKQRTRRDMCGGTDFNAPTKYVNETGGFDGLIIATDMEAPKPVGCRVQRLWITDDYHGNRPYFNPTPERMIVIPKKDR